MCRSVVAVLRDIRLVVARIVYLQLGVLYGTHSCKTIRAVIGRWVGIVYCTRTRVLSVCKDIPRFTGMRMPVGRRHLISDRLEERLGFLAAAGLDNGRIVLLHMYRYLHFVHSRERLL